MPLFYVWFSTKKRVEALQDDRREFVLDCFKRIAAENDIDLIKAEAQFTTYIFCYV